MLVIQSLGLYFDKPDVILFGHFSTNISLKASKADLEPKKEFLVLEKLENTLEIFAKWSV